MKAAAWITLLYAILVFFGGLMGHIKAASTASLVMGTIFGFLLFLTSLGMFKNKLFSAYIGILLILLLDGFFTYRFLYTLSFFPAGFMSLVSLGVLLAVALLLRNHLRRERR